MPAIVQLIIALISAVLPLVGKEKWAELIELGGKLFSEYLAGQSEFSAEWAAAQTLEEKLALLDKWRAQLVIQPPAGMSS